MPPLDTACAAWYDMVRWEAKAHRNQERNAMMVRFYSNRHDWAGIGRPHFMIAWTWRGIPRSLVW